MISTLLEAAGVVLITAGVAVVWWPGALMLAGAYLVLAGIALERRRA